MLAIYLVGGAAGPTFSPAAVLQLMDQAERQLKLSRVWAAKDRIRDDLRSLAQEKAAYCSRECQVKHWKEGGHKADPALEAYLQRREVIAGDIAKLEKQIYDLESAYFTADCTNFGNVVKGFNEFLTSKSAQAKNKNRQFRMEDRVFSLSSITSPGTLEMQQAPAEQPAAYQGAVPFQQGARGVAAAPPPKRRY
ncbi:chromatin modification-related MEAF6-like isoform X2 [Chlorella sorokiniana]|uniref:Chromatin modification-related MEAF6-like isoform X2 n=1 Tax=Chlorella sorokiniana TaxID=3076 RepID=A0A2P6TUX8_CHLSO|nr:chromatin modification-related MEAF6-like isoform X2 [Chlorella sorokiniana]|eukprot:PRW57873.1 chromatin modification-related MEAF6-like isoform X2 [Chlorella sorokiniana]